MVEFWESWKHRDSQLKHFRDAHTISMKVFGIGNVNKNWNDITLGAGGIVLQPFERIILVRDSDKIEDATRLAETIEQETGENYKIIFGYY